MNLPIWLAVMPGLVPRKELSNAVSLGGVGFNLAQALGPVLGGVIVAVIGPGAVFLINAVLFLLTLFILIRWHNPQPSSALSAERFISAMSAALRYLGHAPPLQRVLLRSTVFMSCASALLALLPLVAKHDLNMGGLGYGLLQGCLGLGAVIGAIAMPRLRYRFSIDVLIVGATVVYAIMVVAVATLHLVILLFVLLLITGVAWMAFLSSANIATLQAVPKWVQARALGLYLLFLQGGTAAGSVIWGWVAARWGRWDKWSRGIMMKIIVIGGGGHIGSYLVPKLVKAGHKVVSISRGQSKPYTEDPAWRHVEQMILDRDKESGENLKEKLLH